MRILHLSDLHFRSETSARVAAQELLSDLRLGIGTETVNYLVVTGDVSDRCNVPGYEVALDFLAKVRDELKIPSKACIVVPGNHDLSFELDAYVVSSVPGGCQNTIQQLHAHLVPDRDHYLSRFEHFAKFYKQFTNEEYPLDPRLQFVATRSENVGVQFLGLNSAWQIDRFHPDCSSINSEALIRGLKSMRRVKGELRIAVWHHPVTGSEKIRDTSFIEALSRNGFQLGLHGDVRGFGPDGVHGYHCRKLHIVGAGAFAARADDRPHGTPRLYNLLEVDPDHSSVRVRIRAQISENSAWQAYGSWPFAAGSEMLREYYEFRIDSGC